MINVQKIKKTQEEFKNKLLIDKGILPTEENRKKYFDNIAQNLTPSTGATTMPVRNVPAVKRPAMLPQPKGMQPPLVIDSGVEEKSFFEKYKIPLIVGGVAIAGFLLLKKK